MDLEDLLRVGAEACSPSSFEGESSSESTDSSSAIGKPSGLALSSLLAVVSDMGPLEEVVSSTIIEVEVEFQAN